MFKNLTEVQSWLKNGGGAVMHAYVAGEEEWLLSAIGTLEASLAEVEAVLSYNESVRLNARALHSAALSKWQKAVNTHSDTDVELIPLQRMLLDTREKHASLVVEQKVLRDALRAETDRAKKVETGKRLEANKQKCTELAATEAKVAQNIHAYVNPVRPTVEDFYTEKPLPVEDADALRVELARYKAFAAAVSAPDSSAVLSAAESVRNSVTLLQSSLAEFYLSLTTLAKEKNMDTFELEGLYACLLAPGTLSADALQVLVPVNLDEY